MRLEADIKKRLDGFTLDVSFTCDGRITGILGASGCGKSLTLKCIAGIETPDEGRIVLNDTVLFDSDKKINLPPQKRRVGYLFQNYALFPTMTVAENIGIVLNLPRQEKEKRIALLTERFHLEGLEKRYTSELSGGQQQRAALARIFAYEPDILLLDEPFSALDSYLKDFMMQELNAALKEYHGIAVMVSHSRNEIYRLCRNLMIMSEGGLLLSGDVKQIFAEPACMEAAKLTGCKNISEAEWIDSRHVFAKEWGIRLRTAKDVDRRIKYVGIRAHALRPGEESELENTCLVQLVEQEEEPFEILYMFRCGANENQKPLWWKVGNNDVGRTEETELPSSLYFPPDALMLLS